MRDHFGALDVLEELETEPLAFGRAFDDARDVGNDEFLENAQMRIKRREGVAPDFRLGIRDGVDERTLARIRIADEPEVGKQAEFDMKMPSLARLAGSRLVRSRVSRRFEMFVPETALAALEHKDLLSGFSELVFFSCLVLGDDGPNRKLDEQVFALRAGHLFLEARFAVLGQEFRIVGVAREESRIFDAFDIDIAAVPAIAAGRPAAVFEFVLAPANNPVSAGACTRVDCQFIDECPNYAASL